ncbi:MAG: TMEM165/GDT1 family protein [Clostridia bacterium]|nr:TMEM165/GDT1 family protein [Clostridia bacterium]
MSIFLIVFLTIFIAEIGDKSLLILIAMSNNYKVKHILSGVIFAIILLNIIGVTLGTLLSNYIDFRIVKLLAGFMFLFFAVSLIFEGKEENNQKMYKKFTPILSIFLAFFFSELGDKTQLSVVALSANYVSQFFSNNMLFVFLGCTFGLILADVIGIIVGLYLKRKVPTKTLNFISFLIFTIFGFITIFEGLNNFKIFINNNLLLIFLFIFIFLNYFGIIVINLYFKKKKKRFE